MTRLVSIEVVLGLNTDEHAREEHCLLLLGKNSIACKQDMSQAWLDFAANRASSYAMTP